MKKALSLALPLLLRLKLPWGVPKIYEGTGSSGKLQTKGAISSLLWDEKESVTCPMGHVLRYLIRFSNRNVAFFTAGFAPCFVTVLARATARAAVGASPDTNPSRKSDAIFLSENRITSGWGCGWPSDRRQAHIPGQPPPRRGGSESCR